MPVRRAASGKPFRVGWSRASAVAAPGSGSPTFLPWQAYCSTLSFVFVTVSQLTEASPGFGDWYRHDLVARIAVGSGEKAVRELVVVARRGDNIAGGVVDRVLSSATAGAKDFDAVNGLPT